MKRKKKYQSSDSREQVVGWVEQSDTHLISYRPALSPKAVSSGPITPPQSLYNPRGNEPPERGIRPIDGRLYMSMLYRIKMNVITMPPNIVFVPQRVLPVSALPDPTFTFETAAFGAFFEALKTSRKNGFNQSPSCRIIRVTGTQSPDSMQVVGQDNDRIDCERVTALCVAERVPHEINSIYE